MALLRVGRRTRAPKREGAWVGNIALEQDIGQTVQLRTLWSPQETSTYLTAGHLTHQVTYLTLALGGVPNALQGGTLFWGVKVYDTDVTGLVVPAAILDPSDPFSMQHEWMDWGMRRFQPIITNSTAAGVGMSGSSGIGDDQTLTREIRAKRRFSDNEAIALSLVFISVPLPASTISLTVAFRTFCRVSRA